MPVHRLDATGHPVAFARDLGEALLVTAGSAALVGAAVGALWLAAPHVGLPGVHEALTQAHAIVHRVQGWRERHGRLPTELSEVFGQAPRDPWGHPWRLHRQEGGFVLVSLGADGQPGGDGVDADLRVSSADASRLTRRGRRADA